MYQFENRYANSCSAYLNYGVISILKKSVIIATEVSDIKRCPIIEGLLYINFSSKLSVNLINTKVNVWFTL